MSWSSENAAAVVEVPQPRPKRKHTLLPVLVVLFVISYGLMALLVVEQGRTIESQRSLISSLFNDSNQLSHLQGKVFQKQRAEAQAQAQANAHSQAKTPSNQVPSTQTPSAQDKPRDNAKTHNGKAGRVAPLHPPTGVADVTDERRNVNTI